MIESERDEEQDQVIAKAMEFGQKATGHFEKSEVDMVYFVSDLLDCDVTDRGFDCGDEGFAPMYNAGQESLKEISVMWMLEPKLNRQPPGGLDISLNFIDASPRGGVHGAKFTLQEVPDVFKMLLAPWNMEYVAGIVQISGKDIHGNRFVTESDFEGRIYKINGKSRLRMHLKHGLTPNGVSIPGKIGR